MVGRPMKSAPDSRPAPAALGKAEPMTGGLPRSPWEEVLALAWPVLCQQVLVFAVTMSDRFLAGYFEPDIAYQAAQTTASYLAWFLTSYTVFITAGSAALVSRLVGAGDRLAANRATNQSLLLAVVLGLAGTAA